MSIEYKRAQEVCVRERGGESDVQFLDPVSQVSSRSESSIPI